MSVSIEWNQTFNGQKLITVFITERIIAYALSPCETAPSTTSLDSINIKKNCKYKELKYLKYKLSHVCSSGNANQGKPVT